MSKYSLSFVAAAALLAVGAASAAPSHSIALSNAPAKGNQPAAVLYDQNDNQGANGVTSQNFEASFDAYDSEAADDFTVPSGKTWTVTEVCVSGSYSASGPLASAHVAFYSNKKNLPGKVVADYPTASIKSDSAGSVCVTVPKTKLKAGHYWLEVQGNLDFGTGGQWYWSGRTVQAGTSAAWRNVGGGFGTGCTKFTDLDTCIPATFDPDLMFSLGGKSK